MTIALNGKSIDAGSATTVRELIENLGFAPEMVLIEQNGVALIRREWSQKKIAEGDKIELLRVAAGG